MPQLRRFYPVHLRVDTAIGVQFEAAVRRRARVHRIAIAFRQKLRAGGGRREQAHIAALAVESLVNMTPDHRAHVGMGVDDAPKILRVGKPDAIQPAAAHGDGVMMQAHHGVLRGFGQRRIEARELILDQAAADMAGVVAVEHDEIPAADEVRAADLEGAAAQLLAHGLRLVMVAGNAQHRFFQIAEEAAKAQIAGLVVLHQIAGDEHGLIVTHARECLIQGRVQARIGLDTAKPSGGAAVEMRVGDLKNLHPVNASKAVQRRR